jgi:hypothetical protein
MRWRLSKRWTVIGVLALITLVASLRADERGESQAPTAPPPVADSARQRAPGSAGAASEPLPQLDAARLARFGQRDAFGPARADPFETPSTEKPVPAPVQQSAPVPPAPSAPNAPFRFLGAQESDGVRIVYLEDQNRTFIARAGDTVGEVWRLDRVTDRALIFTYIPLQQQRTLTLGGAS